MVFSWETLKAPLLLPRDVMRYFAKFDLDEPYMASTLMVFIANNDGKLEAKVGTFTPNNRFVDFTEDVRIIEQGKRLTIFVPPLDVWQFTGSDANGLIEDGSLLTAGTWTMMTNRGSPTPVGSGSDDACGRDDRDRVPT